MIKIIRDNMSGYHIDTDVPEEAALHQRIIDTAQRRSTMQSGSLEVIDADGTRMVHNVGESAWLVQPRDYDTFELMAQQSGVTMTIQSDKQGRERERRRLMRRQANEVQDRDLWQDFPPYPVRDWQYEVSNNDTRLGYWPWVHNKINNYEEDQDQEKDQEKDQDQGQEVTGS